MSELRVPGRFFTQNSQEHELDSHSQSLVFFLHSPNKQKHSNMRIERVPAPQGLSPSPSLSAPRASLPQVQRSWVLGWGWVQAPHSISLQPVEPSTHIPGTPTSHQDSALTSLCPCSQTPPTHSPDPWAHQIPPPSSYTRQNLKLGTQTRLLTSRNASWP